MSGDSSNGVAVMITKTCKEISILDAQSEIASVP